MDEEEILAIYGLSRDDMEMLGPSYRLAHDAARIEVAAFREHLEKRLGEIRAVVNELIGELND